MNNTNSNNKTDTQPLLFLSPIHKAMRQFGIYAETEMTKFDLSPVGGHLISYIGIYGPVAIAELVRVFGYKPTTMTSMLDRLEDKGLIERAINKHDRRSILVSVTASGQTRARAAREFVERFEEQIRSRVSDHDIKGFQKVMTAFAEATGVDVRKGKQERR